MLKKFKHIKNEKGLTLIELLAVIVILAIIAAIAIPAIGNIIENSRVKAAKSDAANIVSAAAIYFTENSSDTVFTNLSTHASYDSNWADFISDRGTAETFIVTKAQGATASTIYVDGVSNGRGFTISSGTGTTGITLATLDVSSGAVVTSGAGLKWD